MHEPQLRDLRQLESAVLSGLVVIKNITRITVLMALLWNTVCKYALGNGCGLHPGLPDDVREEIKKRD